MNALANVETDKSVADFISSISDDGQREDSQQLVKMIQVISGYEAKVWGDNNYIGFGKYKYSRKGSKQEYEWFNIGFAPRKANITIYVNYDISQEKEWLSELGKCKWSKGCLYIKRLEDVDLKTLEKIIDKSKASP